MTWARLGSLGATLVLVAGVGVHLALRPAADGPGERMLDAAMVPRGSVQTSSLPGPLFAQPSLEPACRPLTDEVRYWAVPGRPGKVAAFLRVHAPSWLPVDGTGSLITADGKVLSYDVTDAASDQNVRAPAELDFTVAALPDGMTGIRADAELVPAGAVCTSGVGPARSG
jgi:hypothetical protein